MDFEVVLPPGTTHARFSLFDALGQPWNGCVEMRPQPYDVQDTQPSATTPGTLFVPNSLSVFFRGNGSGNASL